MLALQKVVSRIPFVVVLFWKRAEGIKLLLYSPKLGFLI
jgi:hypothetical protein